jgi:hypothetical protein
VSLPVSDNFNRSDANPVGGNWTTFSSLSALRISSNTIQGSSSSPNAAYWNADTPEADQYAQIKTVKSSYGTTVGVVIRADAAGDNWYSFRQASSTVCRVYKKVSGTETQLGSDYSHSYTQNAVLKLKVVGLNTDAVLTPAIDGSDLATRSGVSGINSGVFGIRIGNVGGDSDDFYGDNVSAGVSSIPMFMSSYRRRRI